MSYLYILLQWAVLTRKHAKVVVEDETVFPMFQKYCKVMGDKVNYSVFYDCYCILLLKCWTYTSIMDLLFSIQATLLSCSFMLTTLSVSFSFLLIMQKKPLPEFWRDHYIVSSLHDIMHLKIIRCSFFFFFLLY